MRAVVEELTVGGGPLLQVSPVRRAGVRERKSPAKRVATPEAVLPGAVGPALEVPSKKKKNSEMYPKAERPLLFQDDEKFNSLTPDKAGKMCYQNALEEEKKKRKSELKNALEKSDDTIKPVMIPAGEDDCKNNLNIEARKLMRPVVKELGKVMDWFPTIHTEVIRNLPLQIYGLQDSVSTKAIELAHNLSSTLEIKMFSPSNLRSSASSQKQKAFTDKEGSLIVEASDCYEEMKSTHDVLAAWVTLDCVWQKVGTSTFIDCVDSFAQLHPEWPVAKIAVKVILAMRLFVHCRGKAKDVMVTWSNRFLAANASRAANRDSPMSYDK